MAAKGTVAKERLINQLIQVNSEKYVGCFDKKYYFWSEEDGERVQVCISMTCPKTPIEAPAPQIKSSQAIIAEDMNVGAAKTDLAEITQDEKQVIADLMARLGL